MGRFPSCGSIRSPRNNDEQFFNPRFLVEMEIGNVLLIGFNAIQSLCAWFGLDTSPRSARSLGDDVQEPILIRLHAKFNFVSGTKSS